MTLAAPFPLCSFNTVCPALTICDIAAVTALLGPARPGDLHPAAPPGVGRSSKQHVLRSRGGGGRRASTQHQPTWGSRVHLELHPQKAMESRANMEIQTLGRRIWGWIQDFSGFRFAA